MERDRLTAGSKKLRQQKISGGSSDRLVTNNSTAFIAVLGGEQKAQGKGNDQHERADGTPTRLLALRANRHASLACAVAPVLRETRDRPGGRPTPPCGAGRNWGKTLVACS